MSDSEQVHRAKDRLRATVRDRPWYRGIAIVRRGPDLVLRLNVSPEVDDRALPQEFDGIPVEIVHIEGYERRGP